jgi:hypothetical protein
MSYGPVMTLGSSLASYLFAMRDLLAILNYAKVDTIEMSGLLGIDLLRENGRVTEFWELSRSLSLRQWAVGRGPWQVGPI